MKKKVDILLPCYNEEKTLEKCLKDIKKAIAKDTNYEYQIILCDNNSTDSSRDIAKRLKVKTLIEKEKGYGATLLNGINNSKADFLVMLDADSSYDQNDIPKFVKELENYDLVIGNRFEGTIERKAMPLANRIGSQLLTIYSNIFFHIPSHDYHCGLRAIKRDKLLKCNLSTPGFEFASEMLIKAKLNKLKIKEIPTNLFAVTKERKPKLKPFKDGLRHLKTINSLIPIKKIIMPIIVLFLIIYGLLLAYTSNYQEDNGIPIMDIRLNSKNTLNEIHTNDKETKYSNNIMTLDDTKYNNVTIKGRGNSTWGLVKKPYQISFAEKVSLLDLPASKKYVLLANYSDPTLLRNDFTYEVAKKLDLNYSKTGKFVDLYIDKKYLGNYYLIPKVDINSAYVDLKNDNAILMELDNLYYRNETYFISEYFNDYITIKDTKDESNMEYFQKKYNLMEKNISKKNYKWLKENIDIDSFVKYYIIADFALNNDSLQSSFYMYMDGPDDQIHVGPIWDFDIGYDSFTYETKAQHIMEKRTTNPTILFKELLNIKEFDDSVSKYWREEACHIYKEEIDNLDTKIDYLQKSGDANSKYWYNQSYDTYSSHFKEWLLNRYDYYNEKYGCDIS